MQNLKIFENKQFGSIRTATILKEPYFVGKDVASALGYSNASKAIITHVDEEDKLMQMLPQSQNGNMLTQTALINESGLYSLILSSKLPNAKKFKRWVTSEVLPSIRKNGAYMTGETLEKALTSPDFLIELAKKLKEEKQQRLILQNQNTLLEQKVTEYKPKAEYVDKILASKGTLTVTQIAADYGLSARQLNAILHEEKIQHKVGEQWILYKKHMGLGYTKSETIDITRKDGTPDTKMQTKWTQRGRLLIHNILESRGIKANMDKQ